MKNKNLLLAFLLIIGLGLILSSSEESGVKIDLNDFFQKNRITESEQELVNKHLYYGSQAQELQEKQAELENKFKIPKPGDNVLLNEHFIGLEMSQDKNEQNVVNDLNRGKSEIDYQSPSSIIQRENSNQDLVSLERKRAIEKYISQFLENARKNGYDVELNEKYEVIRVRQLSGLKTPNGQSAK